MDEDEDTRGKFTLRNTLMPVLPGCEGNGGVVVVAAATIDDDDDGVACDDDGSLNQSRNITSLSANGEPAEPTLLPIVPLLDC